MPDKKNTASGVEKLESIAEWFHLYGYLVLFVGLLLEYIALPFPGELTLSYAGLLVQEGSLNLYVCAGAAFLGTALGQTLSYVLGRKLGYPFLEKFGSKVGLGPDKLAKTRKGYEKYGNKLLLVSCFIPGVRHLTGYLSGVLGARFRSFALYAYIGIAFWVMFFLVLGRTLGPYLEHWMHEAGVYFAKGLIVAAPGIALGMLLHYGKRHFARNGKAKLYASLAAAACTVAAAWLAFA